jgi:acyl transferase domain-containing protein
MHSLSSLLDFENHLDISFVEIGPHSTIKSTVQESLPKQWDVEKSYTSVLIQHQSAVSSTLTVAGRLHCLGHPVDLHAVNNPSSTSTRRGKVLSGLPPYPFDHSKSRWLESRASKSYRLRSLPYRDFLGTRSLDWNPLEPQWNNRINMQENSFVLEHEVSNKHCI